MTTQIKPRPLEENASYTRFGHNSLGTVILELDTGLELRFNGCETQGDTAV